MWYYICSAWFLDIIISTCFNFEFVRVMFFEISKKVDILFSKNQVLQILYLKHHVYININYHGRNSTKSTKT